jgi:hypothetical protein
LPTQMPLIDAAAAAPAATSAIVVTPKRPARLTVSTLT